MLKVLIHSIIFLSILTKERNDMMTRNEQKIAMLEKTSKILNELSTSNFIIEISGKTGILESTIQKLLHKPDLIAELLDIENELENLRNFMFKLQKCF